MERLRRYAEVLRETRRKLEEKSKEKRENVLEELVLREWKRKAEITEVKPPELAPPPPTTPSTVEKIERTPWATLIWSRSGELATLRVKFDEKELERVIDKGTFHIFTPLVESPDVLEVFICHGSVYVSTRDARWRVVFEFKGEKDIESIITKGLFALATRSYAFPSLESPVAIGELENRRIIMKMSTRGRWECSIVKIGYLPKLGEVADPLLTARLMTLALGRGSTVIFGPPGSGKTTFLNILLNELVQLYPVLRITVIEPTAELVLPRGYNISHSVASKTTIRDLLGYAIQYERPDLLVLGELSVDDIERWIRAKLGMSTLTTIHGRSLRSLLRTMTDGMRRCFGSTISSEDVLNYLDNLIQCYKYVEPYGGIQRGIEAVYRIVGSSIQPIYDGTYHLEEDEFLEILPETSIVAKSCEEVYELMKERYCVKNQYSEKMRKLQPISLDDLGLRV